MNKKISITFLLVLIFITSCDTDPFCTGGYTFDLLLNFSNKEILKSMPINDGTWLEVWLTVINENGEVLYDDYFYSSIPVEGTAKREYFTLILKTNHSEDFKITLPTVYHDTCDYPNTVLLEPFLKLDLEGSW